MGVPKVDVAFVSFSQAVVSIENLETSFALLDMLFDLPGVRAPRLRTTEFKEKKR